MSKKERRRSFALGIDSESRVKCPGERTTAHGEAYRGDPGPKSTIRFRASLDLVPTRSASSGIPKPQLRPDRVCNQSTRRSFDAAACSRVYGLRCLIGVDAFRESPLTSMTQMAIFRASLSDNSASSCRCSSRGFPGRVLEGWGCV